MKKAIYKITNKITNKIYIGQTTNPHNRWKAHKSNARRGRGIGRIPLYDALRRYGVENFNFEIIGWFCDYNEKEQHYIKLYNSLIPNGYNVMSGGEDPPHKFGEEHHSSVYKQSLVDDIIDALISKKYTQKQIQDMFGVGQQLVTSINRGVTHRRAGISYPIIKDSLYHLNKADVDKIIYLLKNSQCTCAEIGAYFGVTTSSIKAINSGRNSYRKDIEYPIRNFRGKSNAQSVETILAKRSTKIIDTSSEM